jgi:16S rRNA (adenine1518-N6/adenine1519-N6)-dimethyltransferase
MRERRIQKPFDGAQRSPKKALGQHFLMHRRIAERIVMAAGVTKEDTVLEIGPGRGLLTRELLDYAKKVIAVETDSELIPQLELLFAAETGSRTLILIEKDVRVFDPETIAGSYKLVANIPYYITGEIIRQFLTTQHTPTSMTLLVQKEVAERIVRSKKESLLSLSVKVYGTPKYCFTVPKGAFIPAPTIDSAVLLIENIATPFNSDAEESYFFKLLHAGFAHKRKQLVKNLEELIALEEIRTILEKLGLPLTVRAEDIPLKKWLEISKETFKKK